MTQKEKIAYRPAEFMSAFGVGRGKTYSLIHSGDLKVLKSGRCTLITAESVDSWMRKCAAEAERGKCPVPRRRRR